MKYKNLIFFILSIILIIGVAIFNYKMDYYEIDEKLAPVFYLKKYKNLNNYYLVLKKYKNFKFDKVIIGSSTSCELFEVHKYLKDYKIAHLAIPNINLSEQKKLLEIFLDMHPECKEIIIPAGYPSFSRWNENILKEYNGENITIDDFASLYLSIDITFKNLNKIIEYIKEKLYKNDDYNFYVYIFENRKYAVNKINDEAIKAIKEISKLCKERNLKVTCLIEPFHIYYIADIYRQNKYDQIKLIKKILVDEFDNILDFSIVNELNIIKKEENFIFTDILHPNFVYGEIIFNAILNKKNDKIFKHLYTKINKNNLNDELVKYEKDIKKYVFENKKEIESYLNNVNYNYFPSAKYSKKYIKDLPYRIKKYL